jgi:DNA mismatch repair protein MutH
MGLIPSEYSEPKIVRTPPNDEGELVVRARGLAGLTLGQAAAQLGLEPPLDLHHHKGWVGNLIERLLGATAGSRDEPDFPHLGVELKTIPVNRLGRALETTFVCTVDLLTVADTEWRDSRVYRKLAKVLWVPILAEPELALTQRLIGTAFVWELNEEQERGLRWDWEELAGMIGRGDVDEIRGHLGTWLQVRPKAANSKARRRGFDADGSWVDVLPRGFYLRQVFTEGILAQVFGQSTLQCPTAD